MDNERKTMSVPQMRKLLGLKKTASYWLVHQHYFKTEIVDGIMRVDCDSFEKWYANQTKHKKVTGEAPGKELMQSSYSFQDVANMLGEHNSTIYTVWNKLQLPTVTVDYVKRIPKGVFDDWYASQDRYRKVDVPATIEETEKKFILFKEAAGKLGMSGDELLAVVRYQKLGEKLDMRMFNNKRYISRTGFAAIRAMQKDDEATEENISLCIKRYISKKEAAQIAKVSKSTITKWALNGFFPCEAAGYVMIIEKEPFLKWLKNREGRE